MGVPGFPFVWLVNKTLVMTLCVGITFGFSFAYMVLTLAQYGPQGSLYGGLLRARGREWFGPDPISLFSPRLDAPLQSGLQPGALYGHNVDMVPQEHSADDPAHAGGDVEALELAKRVRVLCWVMTQPANHEKKARHVKATWGKRCNKLIFMSSEADTKLPSVKLNVQEGRNFLWAKTKEAFRYVYEHHLEEADWFFKADDDTYAVMENMRFMLEPYSPQDAIYFGCKFKPFTKQGYMSGGAGYVLSREALKRFVEVGLKDPKKCKQGHGGAEDAEMGKCLEKLNVTAGDSRDGQGRYRFFPFTPESHLVAEKFPKNFWYWKYIFYPQPRGMDCCSDSAISFHYVPPNMMYTIEYLIYHLKPYGVRTRLIPAAPPDSAVVPAGAHFPTGLPPAAAAAVDTTAPSTRQETVPATRRATTRAALKATSRQPAQETDKRKGTTPPAQRVTTQKPADKKSTSAGVTKPAAAGGVPPSSRRKRSVDLSTARRPWSGRSTATQRSTWDGTGPGGRASRLSRPLSVTPGGGVTGRTRPTAGGRSPESSDRVPPHSATAGTSGPVQSTQGARETAGLTDGQEVSRSEGGQSGSEAGQTAAAGVSRSGGRQTEPPQPSRLEEAPLLARARRR